MASLYNFKKETKLYLVYGGSQYLVDISDISFSQTFTENSHPVKTLHEQTNMFEASTINKANPANFEFSIPILRESDLSIVLDLLLDYDSSGHNINYFDLYISTQKDIFKITSCVISEGNFTLEKLKPLGLSVSGEGTKLERMGDYGTYTIPGTPITRSGTRTYNIIRSLDVTLDSVALSNVYKVSVAIQNNIDWTGYTDIHSSLSVTNAASSMYPSNYVLKDRVLSGSFSQYVSDNTLNDLQQWSTDAPLRIKALDGIYGFDFNMTNCSFTNRLTTDSVFTESYDWRLVQNPSELSDIITYITT